MKKFKYIRQNDESDCGVACVATIFHLYGLDVSIAQIREIAGTDKEGTTAYGINRVAKHFGYDSKVVEISKKDFSHELPFPAIAHIINERNQLHYVVIKKISGEKVYISDPAKGLVKVNKKEFIDAWTGVLIFIVPTEEAEYGNKKIYTLKSFYRLILSYKALVFCVFFISLVITVLGIGTSLYYKVLMDTLIPNSSVSQLALFSVVIIIFYVLHLLASFLRSYLVMKMEQKIDEEIILKFYSHILMLPLNFFTSRKTGEILSRFNDASKIRVAISEATITIMLDTLLAFGGGIIMFIFNRNLFIVSVSILLLYFVIVCAYKKTVKEKNEDIMEANAQVTSQFVESVTGIETIKSFCIEKRKKHDSSEKYKNYLRKILSGQIVSISQHMVTQLTYAIGSVCVLWIGAMGVIEGSLTIGELIAFNALIGYFLDPVKNLINLQPNIQIASVAADRLGEILELTPELDLPLDEIPEDSLFNKRIKIVNLNFRYGTRSLVLDDVSMEICNRQKIAFVGESGSGKTTLAKLLLRFYDFEKGKIFFDDKEISDISISFLRDKIAYVSQDIFMFSGTIKDNLLIGKPAASDEELRAACELAGVSEYIEGLPLKYMTIIQENGKNLSGGQKQRIAIARALLKKPQLLILDEATSNLDTITEKMIENTINRLSQEQTVIIIAHRLSTIKNCDCIYVFDKGKIIEKGTHQELMNSCCKYADLFMNYIQ